LAGESTGISGGGCHSSFLLAKDQFAIFTRTKLRFDRVFSPAVMSICSFDVG